MNFKKNFKTPEEIPKAAIERANELLSNGHLFRYEPYEDSSGNSKLSDTSLFESEFRKFTGHKYAVAVNSCGSAMFLALKASGLGYGEEVFCCSFTFGAVPSSIVHAGGKPIYIETTNDFIVDITDFQKKIAIYPNIKYFLLSYMRGHIPELDVIQRICEENNIVLIEDCAHALGSTWYDRDGARQVGFHGVASCFSSQSAKLINSGEGGILVTDDEKIAAYALIAAGCYEKMYLMHNSAPDSEIIESMIKTVPNYSLRMNNLIAAILTPQLSEISDRVKHYNELYDYLKTKLLNNSKVLLPSSTENSCRVGSSCQFSILGIDIKDSELLVESLKKRGFAISCFGQSNNARNYANWHYSYEVLPTLQKTKEIISCSFDFKIPYTFNKEDINLLVKILDDEISKRMN